MFESWRLLSVYSVMSLIHAGLNRMQGYYQVFAGEVRYLKQSTGMFVTTTILLGLIMTNMYKPLEIASNADMIHVFGKKFSHQSSTTMKKIITLNLYFYTNVQTEMWIYYFLTRFLKSRLLRSLPIFVALLIYLSYGTAIWLIRALPPR